MAYWVVYPITYTRISSSVLPTQFKDQPGPAAAANASSPIEKSKSSVPLLAANAPPEPLPPVRYDGLLATAGLPCPEPPPPLTPPLVAIAVGKTKEGASLPANPETS